MKMKMGSKLKRFLSLALAIMMVISLMPQITIGANAASVKTIYLNAGGSSLWDQGGAWFAAWTWGGSTGDAWAIFEKTSEDGIYQIEIPSDRTGMKLLRMSSAAKEPSWTKVDGNKNGYWNNTGDLSIFGNNNLYTITGWGEKDGKWSHKHIPGAAATCEIAQTCTACGAELATATGHDWSNEDGYCVECEAPCPELNNHDNSICLICGYVEPMEECPHSYHDPVDGVCDTCHIYVDHLWDEDGNCMYGCGMTYCEVVEHEFQEGFCIYCEEQDPDWVPPVEDITVYVINSSNWGYVNAYAWDDNLDPYVSWPGEAMEKTDDTADGSEIYSYTLPETYTNILFNGDGNQTTDLIVQSGRYYDLKSGEWCEHTGNVPKEDPLATTACLVGSFNNWSTTQDVFKKADAADTTATVAMMLDAGTTYEFKVICDGSWTAPNTATEITGDVSGLFFSTSGIDNAKITANRTGKYIFTWDLSGNTLSVTYPFTCEVSFATGEGTPVDSQTVVSGTTATMPTRNPTREGYDFGGWYTDEACTVAYNFATEVSSDLTLYAKWVEQEVGPGDMFAVYFDPNGVKYDAPVYAVSDCEHTDTRSGLVHLIWNEALQLWETEDLVCELNCECTPDQLSISFYSDYVNVNLLLTDVLENSKIYVGPAHEHEFEDGKCECGESDPDYEAPEEAETITVYFRNDWLWPEVYVHYWNEDKSIESAWRGDKMTKVGTDNDRDVYAAQLPAGVTGMLFNGDHNENGSLQQTPDIKEIIDGQGYIIFYDSTANNGVGANTYDKFTYVPAEEEEPAETVSYAATFHFANTLNWSVVNLYTWIGSGTQLTGAWPGSATSVVNGYNTATVTFDAPAGQSLNFIFNDGSTQTVDLELAAEDFKLNGDVYKTEKWVVLTTKDGDQYNAAIVDSPEAIVNSPVVDGTSVTFNYGDKSATSVFVAGTFNGWSGTANEMTKDENGVWTATVNNLQPGAYEYKFVVDGENWIIDPMNGNTVMNGDNHNSVFYVLSDEDVDDTNTVTINVHYSRTDGKYDNWNLWVWSSSLGGRQVDFETTDSNGAKVATIVLTNAREHQDISFKERKSLDSNEWAEQGSDRGIDLSTVVSGTIDFYIPSGECVYGDDVIRKNKISSVSVDYDSGSIAVVSVQAIPNPEKALKLVKGDEEIPVTMTAVGSRYTMTLPETVELKLSELHEYKVDYYGSPYSISIDAAYASEKFAKEFTYEGDDLGAIWSKDSTTFRVWAPTAAAVNVKLYTSGTAGTDDLVDTVAMTADVNGTWVATVAGDLNGTYYTYEVNVEGVPVEAVDPYARTTGVNGKRGMVIDLDSTNPAGWGSDKNPNPVTSQTDAIIYELHVRDFSIDNSSGMTNKGKYLAFTETGTTIPGTNISTGIDYLEDLGITHLHLLPVYDYGSVKEDKLDKAQFNWGYDPVNYNVPEGSYSTDPYNGAVRVKEFKQMVKSLHDHDISVVMDVVYNHVYNAEEFCFNNIVPGYFSRVNSNISGCGNDTASEREMVRKYIVESVLYWAEEYHIDGFRFDLVGLLDVQTINEIVTEVHKIYPSIIFYGEGWNMDATNKEPGTEMAKQGNASKTPGFAYFSDGFRDEVGAKKISEKNVERGFVSGKQGMEGAVVNHFKASPWWTSNPQQVVQYVSCHDNYTMADKLIIATGKSKVDDEIIKMNDLAAAMYLTAQGVPFIHAGEEFLREKLDTNGTRVENSYNASDYVNHLDWNDLTKYADDVAYYKGLIAFRKAHPALRMSNSADIKANVYSRDASGNLVSFWIDGRDINGETHDGIYLIFNANNSSRTVALPAGNWDVCIKDDKAGTAVIETVSGSVNVAGISAMVLVQKNTVEEPSSSKSDVALPGSFNSWNQGNFMEVTEDKDVVVQTLSLPAGTYTFKVKQGDAWYGNGGTINNTAAGWVMDPNAGDCTLVASGGAYTFTFVISEKKLTVTHDPNGGEFGDPNEYYLFGWINGADYAVGFETGEYKFDEDGKLTTTFASDSYVMVKNGDSSKEYKADGFPGAVKSATLYDTSKYQATDAEGWNKMMIPGGVEVTISIVMNADNTVTISYEANNASSFEDASGIQKGVTLHAWNWSFNEIKANLATIAAQGYTAVQTSPIQPLKEITNGADNNVRDHWWVYYQPIDFVITTDAGNALGTKAEFEAMCAEAEKYGIKIIVDVVANHLANKTGNDLSEAIDAEIRNNKEYWHDIKTDITDWSNRYDMTQHCMGGLPDLNTANKDIQNMVLAFLKECVDAGADGFRFDAAKSIETPKDDASFASDFWPTVVGGIQEYAEGKLYIYGEILDDPKIAISAYTQYMSVTDNTWSNGVRNNVAGGKAELVAGYHKAADASNLVIWAESHDTYADGSSSNVSEANINKTWALIAARADAMGLYLARPESLTQAIGVASSTGWDNPEVAAANKFHNTFVGASETVGNSGNISYVVRGETGIVMVNTKGNAVDVELNVSMADGTYADQITGNAFTVANGKISGKIGDTGIAVVCGEKEEPAECPYEFGQTSQIWLIEPWALRANLRLYHPAEGDAERVRLTAEEMAEIDDYGVYFVRESDLGMGDVTQEDVTVEDIINNEHVIHNTKANGEAEYRADVNAFSSDFDEGIYTYQLSDSVFLVYYIVEDGNTYYAGVRERNLSKMVEEGITDTKNYKDTERAIFAEMHQLEIDILERRGGAYDTAVPVMDAPTLAEYPVEGEVKKDLSFGHTMGVVLVEPWGIQFNGKVRLDKEYDDYGVIVFYDTEGKLSAAPTEAELLKIADAHVFSVKNGDATLGTENDGRTKITAIYNSGLYTYQMRKPAYVMFYVKDGNDLYCGDVKVRTIESAIDSRLSVDGVEGTNEADVLNDMKALYVATVAHRGVK